MRRREFYKSVADLRTAAGGTDALLGAAASEMGRIRGISAGESTIPLGLWEKILRQDDALGQIYQAINAPALEAAYRATARDGRKFTTSQIPTVTQLFTPKWVVEFLLHNTLGRLWRDMHPDTRLAARWKWMVNRDPAHDEPLRPAADLRICDPACGTMNFGLVAIDMLREMYREEMDRAGSMGWAQPSCSSLDQIDENIIRLNLIGFDLDPVAIDLARQSLEIKIGRKIPRDQLSVADALFDRLNENKFDLVVANPPYLSARNLSARTVARMKKRFPAAWRDSYACFILRALELVRMGGRCGILCMQSFMFTAAFEALRNEIAQKSTLETAAHFGPGLFDIGNPGTLQTVAMTLRRGESHSSEKAAFFRLVDEADKKSALAKSIRDQNGRRFEISTKELSSFPRGAWMYWIDRASQRAFREFPKLGQIAPPRQGLATTDNARFVRYWWEVESPGFAGERNRWFPYAKGGRFRRWYEAARHRVNWEEDGREIKAEIIRRYPYLNGQWQWVAKNSEWYGRQGITYSYLTSGSFSARRLESGTIFDVAGSSLFPDDPLVMLGILNSSSAGRLLAAINPTVNFQVGDLRQLPIPPKIPAELRPKVARAIELTRTLDSYDETTTDFQQPAPWGGGVIEQLTEELARIDKEIDSIVADTYGMRSDREQAAEKSDGTDILMRWISYALGIWLGRWGGKAWGKVAELSPLSGKLADELRQILTEKSGPSVAAHIDSQARSMEKILAREFLPWHNRMYRYRPVVWGFSGNEKIVAVSALNINRDVLQSALRNVGGEVPTDWKRRDDGIARDLLPMLPWLSERQLQLAVKKAGLSAAIRESQSECVQPRRPIRRRAASPRAGR